MIMPITKIATMMMAAMIRIEMSWSYIAELFLWRGEARDGAIDVLVAADEEDPVAGAVSHAGLARLKQDVMGATAKVGGLGFGGLALPGLAANDGGVTADQFGAAGRLRLISRENIAEPAPEVARGIAGADQ